MEKNVQKILKAKPVWPTLSRIEIQEVARWSLSLHDWQVGRVGLRADTSCVPWHGHAYQWFGSRPYPMGYCPYGLVSTLQPSVPKEKCPSICAQRDTSLHWHWARATSGGPSFAYHVSYCAENTQQNRLTDNMMPWVGLKFTFCCKLKNINTWRVAAAATVKGTPALESGRPVLAAEHWKLRDLRRGSHLPGTAWPSWKMMMKKIKGDNYVKFLFQHLAHSEHLVNNRCCYY